MIVPLVILYPNLKIKNAKNAYLCKLKIAIYSDVEKLFRNIYRLKLFIFTCLVKYLCAIIKLLTLLKQEHK